MKTKIKFRKVLIAAAFCFALTLRANAQSVTEARITMTEINGQTNSWQGAFVVTVSDTTNVSQIKVMIGTSDDANDVCDRTFDFDITAGLPAGYSYSREGNKLTLGIATFTERSTYFGNVKVKDNSGNWSDPFKIVAN